MTTCWSGSKINVRCEWGDWTFGCKAAFSYRYLERGEEGRGDFMAYRSEISTVQPCSSNVSQSLSHNICMTLEKTDQGVNLWSFLIGQMQMSSSSSR